MVYDFESYDGMMEECFYQKFFFIYFGYFVIIGLWVLGNLFYIVWQGNFEQWVVDFLYVCFIVYVIWDFYFG